MGQKLVCPSDGRKGGFSLFWKNDIKVQRLELEPMFIDVKIEEGNNIWRLTDMYGEFRWENKYKTCDRIRHLHQSLNLPWIMIGDLNEICCVNYTVPSRSSAPKEA